MEVKSGNAVSKTKINDDRTRDFLIEQILFQTAVLLSQWIATQPLCHNFRCHPHVIHNGLLSWDTKSAKYGAFASNRSNLSSKASRLRKNSRCMSLRIWTEKTFSMGHESESTATFFFSIKCSEAPSRNELKRMKGAWNNPGRGTEGTIKSDHESGIIECFRQGSTTHFDFVIYLRTFKLFSRWFWQLVRYFLYWWFVLNLTRFNPLRYLLNLPLSTSPSNE